MFERGFDTHHIGTDHYSDELGERIADYSPRQIVFPILQMKDSIPPSLLEEGTELYTGIASEEWLKPLKRGRIVTPFLS